MEQAVQEDPEVTDIKAEAFAVLPTKDQFEDYNDPSNALPDWLPEEQGEPLAYSGEVADVAAVTDSSELRVQHALDKLQSDTARVRTDDRRYWKEV